MRPVVATINTPMHAIGKIEALWLKPITKQVSTHTRDSDYLIKKLHQLGRVEDDEHLFTADDVAMHPNINTDEGIAEILL